MVATTSKQCQTEPDPAELALTQLQFELEQLSETNGNIAAENAQLKHELSDQHSKVTQYEQTITKLEAQIEGLEQ